MNTAQMVAQVEAYLTSIGIANVSSCERWERDGVFVVSGDHVGYDDNSHWYLWVSGDDVKYFDPGQTLVMIRTKNNTDECVVLENLTDIPSILAKHYDRKVA